MVKADKKAKKGNKIQDALIRLGLLLGIVVLVNVIGHRVYERFDLTKEKRYTVSEPTKEMLRDLDDIVYIKVYLEGEFPAGIRRLNEATRDLLNEFRAYGGNKIEYTFIDPLDFSEEEKEALFNELAAKGITATQLKDPNGDSYSEKVMVPWALVNYRSEEIPILLLEDQVFTTRRKRSTIPSSSSSTNWPMPFRN